MGDEHADVVTDSTDGLQEETNVKASIYISKINCTSGGDQNFEYGDIVVVVGPNNSGKSTLLKDISNRLWNGDRGVVINDVTINKIGNYNDAIRLIKNDFAQVSKNRDRYIVKTPNSEIEITDSLLQTFWLNNASCVMDHVYNLFVSHLTTDMRLSSANPCEQRNSMSGVFSNNLQIVSSNWDIEKNISSLYKEVFECDLMATRQGKCIYLHVGTRPPFGEPGPAGMTLYENAISMSPRVDQEGDGIRSFVGILLNVFVAKQCIVLLDEPEAFLHPSQAYRLGQIIAREKKADQQIFLSTHSGDFLRGLLSVKDNKVRILRVCRDANRNYIHELMNDDVNDVWRDPLLRYSFALDGLFHKLTIVCEADGDCRLFHATMDAVDTAASLSARDVMFTHCGGKTRMHVIVKALVSLKVPVRATPDIDILNDMDNMKRLVEAFDGNWDNFAADWKIINQWVSQKSTRAAPTKSSVSAAVAAIETEILSQSNISSIKEFLKKPSAWGELKRIGRSYLIGSGNVIDAFDRLRNGLMSIGIFVNKYGELEKLDSSLGSDKVHGPLFVNNVLEIDLAHDGNLAPLREFVSEFIS